MHLVIDVRKVTLCKVSEKTISMLALNPTCLFMNKVLQECQQDGVSYCRVTKQM